MNVEPDGTSVSLGEDMFTSGGEMGKLMRSLDWSATAAGPVERWPQSLRTAVSICLASRFPIIIFWGQRLVQFYNDAYRPILGATKHPAALGQEASACWPEIWDVIGPMLNGVLATGEATWSDDQLLLLDRNGYPEECYFTFSYSPMRDESGGVGGVFCAVTETTGRVLAERRQRTLRELAARAADTYSEEAARRVVGETLENAVAMTLDLPGDLPLALLYLLDADGAAAQLAVRAGPELPQYLCAERVHLSSQEAARDAGAEVERRMAGAEVERRMAEALARVASSGQAEVVELLSVAHRAQVDAAGGGRPPGAPTAAGRTERSEQGENNPGQPVTVTAAMVLPVARPGQARPYGLLVVGINPYVALDVSYRGFLTLLAGQVAAALANARAHDEERRRTEALAELDRAKTAFFSSVSHEFRTPLTLLLGPAYDALTDGDEPLPERQRERIEIVHRNGLRLLKLVNTLLDFSRIEAGRIEASYEPTELATYTAELASMFRSAIERAGLRLTVECPPLPEPVYVDRDMWEKLVFNLLSNAFKFTFAGEIAVRLYLTPGPSPAFASEQATLRREPAPTGRGEAGRRPPDAPTQAGAGGRDAGGTAGGECVALEVRDTGVGIPANELSRIFERFHRVRDTQARTYEGTGIGLSLVRELALLHGGAVEVASAVGEGTTFTVTIPLGTRHLPVERIGAGRAAAPAALGMAFAEEALSWLPEGTSPPASLPAGRGETVADAAGGRPPDAPTQAGVGRGEASRRDASDTGEAEAAGKAPTAEAASGHSPDAPTEASRRDASGTGAARVLVVDDNADMRAYLVRLLEEQGWNVAAAADGAAALALIQAHSFDLVLTDIMMPALDGFGLLRALRGNPATRTLPVILLSARAGEEAAGEGLDAGADDYVVKPFSARELVARVRAHLELARMRRSVAQHSGQLDAIFDAIADLVVVYDVDGNVLRTNPVVGRLLGLEARPDYYGLPVQERAKAVAMRTVDGQPLAPDQFPARRVARGEVAAGSEVDDLLVQALDGRELILNWTGAPVAEGNGTVTGSVIVYRDVTEQRRLERRTYEALAALLRMAETLINTADDPKNAAPPAAPAVAQAQAQAHPAVQQMVLLAQRVLRGEYISVITLEREAREIQPLAVAGLPAEMEAQWWADVQGAGLEDFMAPADAARLYRGEDTIIFDVTAQPPVPGKEYWGIKTNLVTPAELDGRLFVLTVEVRDRTTLTLQERELAGVVVRLVALVTDRERLLREREETRGSEIALLEANRRMDEFLGIASHELKTPLTTIKANVQLLARQMAGEAARKKAGSTRGSTDGAGRSQMQRTMLERTDRQVDRLTRLVNDLVDVSRIREGKLELRPERFDLARVVGDAVAEQRQAWPQRVLSLDTPEEPVMVTADPDRIGQVVTNYLTNALKYSTDEKPVQVTLRVEGNAARVAVRDEGPGLPPGEHQRVWERFHRAEGILEQSGSGVGLGLGLHISKTIVERHDGQVGVESAPGRGSTFWFTLPLEPPSAPEA